MTSKCLKHSTLFFSDVLSRVLFSWRVQEICETRSQWAEAEQEEKSKGGQIKKNILKKLKF